MNRVSEDEFDLDEMRFACVLQEDPAECGGLELEADVAGRGGREGRELNGGVLFPERHCVLKQR